MGDFILNRNRKISVVDPYPFPEKGAFPIYGNGRFYNGFSIGDASNLTVVNRDGVLKISRGASSGNNETSVILGTIKKNQKKSIYIDIASPLSQPITYYGFKIGADHLSTIGAWTAAGITNTKMTGSYFEIIKTGGVLRIYFKTGNALPAIPDLLAVRAIWLYG